MAVPMVAGVAAIFLGDNPGSTPADVTKAVVDWATTGRISSPYLLSGTPNRLLFSRMAYMYMSDARVVASGGVP